MLTLLISITHQTRYHNNARKKTVNTTYRIYIVDYTWLVLGKNWLIWLASSKMFSYEQHYLFLLFLTLERVLILIAFCWTSSCCINFTKIVSFPLQMMFSWFHIIILIWICNKINSHTKLINCSLKKRDNNISS